MHFQYIPIRHAVSKGLCQKENYSILNQKTNIRTIIKCKGISK